jgi:fructokinase
MNSKRICCFGEILWDLFPEGKKLGGAPFNVASSLKDLGSEVCFISKIGKDSLGDEILDQIAQQNISSQYVQIDTRHPTGKVLVELDKNGSAHYKIETNAAWDFVEATPEALKIVAASEGFVFGSLIARGNSYKALNAFLEISKFSIFDLNLRPPFYDQQLLITLMQKAHLIKFNDEELYKVAEMLDSPYHSMDQHIKFISEVTQTKTICVTKGMFGAVLFHNDAWFYNSGFKVKVKDTVGAGDSFLATLTHGILNEMELQITLNRACAMGALVAGSSGANPSVSENELLTFMHGH